MTLRDQPQVLSTLPPELRAGAEEEVAAILARRLANGVAAYIFFIAMIWGGLDYRNTHPTLLIVLTVVIILSLMLRQYAISRREVLYRRSPETWYRLIGITVIVPPGTIGFLLAYTMSIYSFENWNFILAVILNAGLVSGAMVSLAPNRIFLRTQVAVLLWPPLAVALWLHNLNFMQYAFCNIALQLFSFLQSRQISIDFWEQIVSRAQESQRRHELELARTGTEKALDEAQKARLKAEQATKARSEFLAQMSHEIRTPMNAVMGMTNLLLDEDLTPQALDSLGVIRSSSEALMTVINDILDFSKIESGKLDLENEPFSLRNCVEEVLELLSGRASEKNLELVGFVHPEVAHIVEGDVTRLRQILLNLVGNSIKFTAKGEVEVRVELLENTDQDGVLSISVRDTGIGIPEAKLSKLFRSFEQLDSSTARRFGGSGLGLAISKRLAQLMGGDIVVTSQLDVGSVFTVAIPYRPSKSPPQTFPATGHLKGKRALLVEDNQAARTALSSLLAEYEIQPLGVSSATEALAQLRTVSWDIVLIDADLPFTNGLDLARLIRREFGIDAPHLILLTSTAAKNGSAKSSNVSSDAIAKPIRRQALYRALCKVLGVPTHSIEPTDGKIFDVTFAERMPLRILLAEDNPINQKVLIRMLSRLGYRVDAVNNGLEVLSAVDRATYDLILMDVIMPELNGLEATRELISKLDANRPWITALTAGAMKENREECFEAGVDDFVSKPVEPKTLEEALERCYRNSLSRAHKPRGAMAL